MLERREWSRQRTILDVHNIIRRLITPDIPVSGCESMEKDKQGLGYERDSFFTNPLVVCEHRKRVRMSETSAATAGGDEHTIDDVSMRTELPMTTKKPSQRWSQQVTQTSNALDLEEGVFTLQDPRAIARSLKDSAEASSRRKSDPFRSAMSMLTFYINRAGNHLPAERRICLEQAKDELRALFSRPRKTRGG